jgi:hypothetical protein
MDLINKLSAGEPFLERRAAFAPGDHVVKSRFDELMLGW